MLWDGQDDSDHLDIPQPHHALVGTRHGHRVEKVETVEGDVDTLDVIFTRSAQYGQTPPSTQVPELGIADTL